MIDVMNMKSVEKDGYPTKNTTALFLVKCPDWCDCGYQVCEWFNAKQEFSYPDAPNDMFHDTITHWEELVTDYVFAEDYELMDFDPNVED